MPTAAIIVLLAVPAVFAVMFGVGAVLLVRRSVKAASDLSSIRTSPQDFAQRFGWSYREAEPASGLSGHPFDLVPQREGEMRHVLRGTLNGHDMQIFQYTVSDRPTGRNESPTFNVWIVELHQSLPTIEGTPGDALNVHADDPAYATQLISAQFKKLLEKNRSIAWRIKGRQLLSWRMESSYEPDQLMMHAKTVVELVDAINQDIWRRYGTRTPG